MAVKKKGKGTFTLQEMVASYTEGCVIDTAGCFIGAVCFVLYLFLKGLTQGENRILLCFPLALLCMAMSCIIKIIGYRSLLKETKKIVESEIVSEEICVLKIKKRYHVVSAWMRRVSVYTVYYDRKNTKNRYFFLPLSPCDEQIEHLVKHNLRVELYRGTRLIKSFSDLDCGNPKASPVAESLAENTQGEKTSGLWGDIVTAYENGDFKTIWSSDVTVTYCFYDTRGDMIDITLEKGDHSVCFNIDSESLYVGYPPSDEDETLLLTRFCDMDTLLSYMRKCSEILQGK